AFMIAVIVAPDGDRSIAMSRACFEPASPALLLGSPAVCAADFGVGTGVADDATVRLRLAPEFDFAAVDIEILRSVCWRRRAATTEAPLRPAGRRGRISERPRRPKLRTVPLQSQLNASPFWITLLLSFGALDHAMGAEFESLPLRQTRRLTS